MERTFAVRCKSKGITEDNDVRILQARIIFYWNNVLFFIKEVQPGLAIKASPILNLGKSCQEFSEPIDSS